MSRDNDHDMDYELTGMDYEFDLSDETELGNFDPSSRFNLELITKSCPSSTNWCGLKLVINNLDNTLDTFFKRSNGKTELHTCYVFGVINHIDFYHHLVMIIWYMSRLM